MHPTTRPDSHAEDHELLVVRLFGLDVDPAEERLARDLVASCGDCAALLGDLEAITAATTALPVPPRPRDFTLSEPDAARLRRRRSGLTLALQRWALPLGRGMAAAGLVGVVAAGALSLAPGMGGSASTPDMRAIAAPVGAPAGSGSAGGANYQASSPQADVSYAAASAVVPSMAPAPSAEVLPPTTTPGTKGPASIDGGAGGASPPASSAPATKPSSVPATKPSPAPQGAESIPPQTAAVPPAATPERSAAGTATTETTSRGSGSNTPGTPSDHATQPASGLDPRLLLLAGSIGVGGCGLLLLLARRLVS